jgi:hypothetical protein
MEFAMTQRQLCGSQFTTVTDKYWPPAACGRAGIVERELSTLSRLSRFR